MELFNDRQKRSFASRGIDLDKIDSISMKFLNDLQNEKISLEVAKLIVNNMAHTLNEASKYRPETPLSEISIMPTDHSQVAKGKKKKTAPDRKRLSSIKIKPGMLVILNVRKLKL